jgi:hypothetical protein
LVSRSFTPPLVSLLEALLRRAQAGDELGIRCPNPECRSAELVVLSVSRCFDALRRVRRCRACGWLRETVELDSGEATRKKIQDRYPPDMRPFGNRHR